VVWTAGNVSARVRGGELLVIKPSGVGYDELSAGAMVVNDPDGTLVDGSGTRPPTLPPTPTSIDICGTSALSYTPIPRTPPPGAARGEPIPCVLTMMADEFGGDIPLGPFSLIGADSIGPGRVETLPITDPRPC
jgi:L-ribulose-5-phosphate 4-epimerase